MIDLTGQRFGRWTAVRKGAKQRNITWLCRCDCGTEREIQAGTLRNGKSRSCGCSVVTHGGAGTRLHSIWNNMLNRCRNPNVPSFKDYGGRGIAVCPEWAESFATFREWAIQAGYDDTLTIERTDADGNYCPENCTWVPLSAQSMNRRNTLRAPDGTPWRQIAAAHGVRAMIFNSRMSKGWSAERAATTPLVPRG